MGLITFVCDHCGGNGQKKRNHLLENQRLGHRNYCCRECQGAAKSNGKSLPCAQCGISIYRLDSQVKRSKSDRVFCSRRCATIYNNQFKVGDKHPNFNGGGGSYRGAALREYGAICKICGYAVEAVLEVHHIDSDRSNNDLSNLVVLCPTHHKEVELGVVDL